MPRSRIKIFLTFLLVVLALIAIALLTFRSWLATQYGSIAFTSAIESALTGAGVAPGTRVKSSPGQIIGLFGVKIPEIRLSASNRTISDFAVSNIIFRPNLFLTVLTRTIPFSMTLSPQPAGGITVEGKLRFNWSFDDLKLLQTRITLENLETATISAMIQHWGAPEGAKYTLAAFSGSFNGQAMVDVQDLFIWSKGSGNAEATFNKAQFSLPQLSRINLEVATLQLVWRNGMIQTAHPLRLSAKIMGQPLQAAINFSTQKNGVVLDILADGPALVLAGLAGMLRCPAPPAGNPLDALNLGPKSMRLVMTAPEVSRPFKCAASGGRKTQ